MELQFHYLSDAQQLRNKNMRLKLVFFYFQRSAFSSQESTEDQAEEGVHPNANHLKVKTSKYSERVLCPLSNSLLIKILKWGLTTCLIVKVSPLCDPLFLINCF